jgi:hypothetical protein
VLWNVFSDIVLKNVVILRLSEDICFEKNIVRRQKDISDLFYMVFDLNFAKSEPLVKEFKNVNFVLK